MVDRYTDQDALQYLHGAKAKRAVNGKIDDEGEDAARLDTELYMTAKQEKWTIFNFLRHLTELRARQENPGNGPQL